MRVDDRDVRRTRQHALRQPAAVQRTCERAAACILLCLHCLGDRFRRRLRVAERPQAECDQQPAGRGRRVRAELVAAVLDRERTTAHDAVPREILE